MEEKHEMSRKRNDGSWERAGNQGPKEAPKQWRYRSGDSPASRKPFVFFILASY